MSRAQTNTREICRIGLLVAIIAVCAQISIPMPWGVPMTLQTLAVSFAGLLLGPKKGTAAALVYIMLGAIGAPVFANFGGGMGVVFGRTGGFILSFPLMAFAAGVGGRLPRFGAANRFKNKAWMASWLAVGAAVNYLCGAWMFGFVTGTPWATSLLLVAVPFLPATAIEIALLLVFSPHVKKALRWEGAAC
ncbi:MAG: biotin transporter BioY, partial [Defluviitaleaceae bacterium]|nr:biotin transporter BioY [Defluviitaleaceae bacterium]